MSLLKNDFALFCDVISYIIKVFVYVCVVRNGSKFLVIQILFSKKLHKWLIH